MEAANLPCWNGSHENSFWAVMIKCAYLQLCHHLVTSVSLSCISSPFHFPLPLVLKVQKPAFIWGGSCTINITITRKCSRRAEALQVKGFSYRNPALPDCLLILTSSSFQGLLGRGSLSALWHFQVYALRLPGDTDTPWPSWGHVSDTGARGRAAPAARLLLPWEVELLRRALSTRWGARNQSSHCGQHTSQSTATVPSEIKNLIQSKDHKHTALKTSSLALLSLASAQQKTDEKCNQDNSTFISKSLKHKGYQ